MTKSDYRKTLQKYRYLLLIVGILLMLDIVLKNYVILALAIVSFVAFYLIQRDMKKKA